MITYNKNDNTVTGDAAEVAEFVIQYESKLEQIKGTVVFKGDVVSNTTETSENPSGM